MAIGTPVTQVNQLTASIASGVASTPTTNDIPVGSTVFVAVTNNGQANNAILTLVDSAGNTYTQAVQNTATASIFSAALYYCLSTTIDLPVGSTFKATTANGGYGIAVVTVTGAKGGVDATNSIAQTTANTGPSLTTGTLAQSSEIVFGVYNPTNVYGTFTEATGFTSIVLSAAGLPGFAYDIVSATTSVTYNPRTTLTQQYAAIVATFKATSASTPAVFIMTPAII